MSSVADPDAWLSPNPERLAERATAVTRTRDPAVSSVDLWIGVNQCEFLMCV
jgi:hypothetical protein